MQQNVIQVQEDSPSFNVLLDRLNGGLNEYCSLLNDTEDLGHKIANEKHPQDKGDIGIGKPIEIDYIQRFKVMNDKLMGLNERLNQLNSKFSKHI